MTIEEREEFNSRILVVHASWATTVIEGSELTEEEAAAVLSGQKPPKYLERGARETLNVRRASKYVQNAIRFSLSNSLICNINKIVMIGTTNKVFGRYRQRNVRVGGRKVELDVKEVPILMNELIRWYNEMEQRGSMSPLKLATQFHGNFERIHPFEDGNGRTGRLLFDWMMFRHKLPSLVLSLDYIQDYYDGINDVVENNDYYLLQNYFTRCYEILAWKIKSFCKAKRGRK
jgi:Fic family protein